MSKNDTAYDVVYYANGLLDAETIKLFLESQGIEAMITQESAGVTYGLTIGPLGEAKVLVPQMKVEEALLLLKQMEDGKFISNDADESFNDDINRDSSD